MGQIDLRYEECVAEQNRLREQIKVIEQRELITQDKLVLVNNQVDNLLVEIAPLRPPPPPTIQVPVTSVLFRQHLSRICGPNVSIDIADGLYKITTVREFARFIAHIQAWKMIWTEDGGDCDDFTRYAKGRLVCPGWVWQPPLDCWFFFKDGGYHSEFLTLLLDDREVEDFTSPDELEMALFLIEFQARELIQMAEEFFDEATGHRIGNINQ